MSSDSCGAAGRSDLEQYGRVYHDERVIALVEEIGEFSHRGVETTGKKVLAMVTSAVQTAYRKRATNRPVGESTLLVDALDALEDAYPAWFDASAAPEEMDVAGVAVDRSVVADRYWGRQLNPPRQSVNPTDYDALKYVTVPVTGLVLDQVRQQMAADRSAEREAGRNALRGAVVGEVLERDLEPEDVEEAVDRARVELHTREKL